VTQSIEPERKGALSTLDKGLVVAGIVGGIFVVLWVARAVVGLALFAFKVAVLVVVVALAIRLVHLFSRRGG
jgi:uncharacterized membrane protein